MKPLRVFICVVVRLALWCSGERASKCAIDIVRANVLKRNKNARTHTDREMERAHTEQEETNHQIVGAACCAMCEPNAIEWLASLLHYFSQS